MEDVSADASVRVYVAFYLQLSYVMSRADSAQLQPDDAYLSYFDVRLTKEDVDCIKDDWLTDNVRLPLPNLTISDH